MIAVLLAIPLAGAGLLAGIRGRLATALHAATVMATLAIGLAVAVTAARGTEGVALDGFLRVDALSGWMIAVIVSVAALAGAEAPRYAGDGAHRAFYPLLHLMVFTMLLAVSTDDVGVMWVAVEGTTLASVFLVNADRTRGGAQRAPHPAHQHDQHEAQEARGAEQHARGLQVALGAAPRGDEPRGLVVPELAQLVAQLRHRALSD